MSGGGGGRGREGGGRIDAAGRRGSRPVEAGDGRPIETPRQPDRSSDRSFPLQLPRPPRAR